MSGGKGAWERAASSVDARLSHAASSTVLGLSLLVWWQLFVFVCLFFATRVAWDAVFVEFSVGL